jgi:hypothetical protein
MERKMSFDDYISEASYIEELEKENKRLREENQRLTDTLAEAILDEEHIGAYPEELDYTSIPDFESGWPYPDDYDYEDYENDIKNPRS